MSLRACESIAPEANQPSAIQMADRPACIRKRIPAGRLPLFYEEREDSFAFFCVHEIDR